MIDKHALDRLRHALSEFVADCRDRYGEYGTSAWPDIIARTASKLIEAIATGQLPDAKRLSAAFSYQVTDADCSLPSSIQTLSAAIESIEEQLDGQAN